MTLCPSCGADVPIGARLCASCGAEVTDPGAQTVAIATADSQEHDALLAQLKHELAADYDFEKELGRGGMAVVYKAREIELNRPVAIKVLPPSQARRATAERFKREARMAASLDHPSIIQIYRVGQAAGTYFFAMKYIEGRALDAIIEAQGALPLPVILTVLEAAAGGLAYAHERGVVHRDIKGGNILVDREGRVLISDFGIARAPDEKALTVAGSMMGTPYFMSPEACAAGEVGPQSDQYSLGILTFQMITGAVPFESDSLMGLMQHHYFSPVPNVRKAREGLPEELVRLIERALAKDPARRYANTREMLEAAQAIPRTPVERRQGEEMLRDLARGESIPQVRTASLPPVPAPKLVRVSASIPAPPAPAAKPPRYLSPPLLLGGLAAVVVLGLLAGRVFSPGAPRPAAPAVKEAAAPPAPALAAAQPAPQVRRAARRATGPAGASATAARQPAASTAQPAAAAPPAAAPAGIVVVQPQAVGRPGRLRLYTIPIDAIVALDGEMVGTGLADVAVVPGRHRLRVSSPAYITLDTTIQVAAGATVDLAQITLKRRPR